MKKGVIVIHGLTGAPANMAPLSESLARSGFKVVTPLLPGHGTTLEDLSKRSWQEWQEKVAGTFDDLKNEVDEIFCAGLSLGALLTLNLALDPSRRLKKIACIGTPLKLSPILEKIALPLTHIPPIRGLFKHSKKDWEEGVADKIGRELYQGSSYAKIPIHSIWELQRLQKEALKRLPELKTPTILIHSHRDKVALPLNVELFCKTATQIKPELIWLEKSGHVATLDMEKDAVAHAIIRFFTDPVLKP